MIPDKLSKDFKIKEFVNSAGIIVTPTEEQKFCLYVLANNILQPIRDKFGLITITSGLRTKESYQKLLCAGYPASEKSDHFAWSSINPTGTGAADFTCPDVIMFDIFHWVISNLYMQCRQIIYYPDMSIVHVSNNFNNIFKSEDNISNDNRVLIKTKDKGFATYNK